ncbi:hypothetical protein [Parapedobacter tibetensis]|uniref:hypothetical protein n=1 Tax=Parapedobacter tibetensis TaxID=2972951 RepID=UPI00214D86DA|nr:hypothetical protein [Parapedobacter tibetensis]
MTNPNIVVNPERISLTKKQLLWHYSVPFFFLIVPLANLWSIIQHYVFDDYKGVVEPKDLLLISVIFIFVAILLFFLQRNRLKFKEFRTYFTDSSFDKALSKTSGDLKWIVLEKKRNYVRAYRDWSWSGSWGELITIKKDKGRVLINSICNPDAMFISAISYGWNKKNVRTFIDNLSSQSEEGDMIPDNG